MRYEKLMDNIREMLDELQGELSDNKDAFSRIASLAEDAEESNWKEKVGSILDEAFARS